MEERLLCNCNNTIIAKRVISILMDENVIFHHKDETVVPHAGAKGPMPGILIYVRGEDYERAKKLVDPLIDGVARGTTPFCPKCGGMNVSREGKSRYTSGLLILCLFLFMAPLLYLFYTNGSPFQSTFLHHLSIVVFCFSIVLLFVVNYKNRDFKCNRCGKRFNRK